MIYLDSASTTEMSTEVVGAMFPYLTSRYANPNSAHKLGREARRAIDNAREQVASLLKCEPENIVFTSGGSEANSMVFHGLKNKLKEAGKTQILVSQTEHISVLNAVAQLEKEGFDVIYLPVSENGTVFERTVREAITDKTGLVSVMAINNETGVENDIFGIGRLCRGKGILYHTDCVQATTLILDSNYKLPCDFISISGHKIHGPKGVGALYIANRDGFEPLVCGSKSQEFGIRGGTENVSGVVGFGEACWQLLTANVYFASRLRNEFLHALRRNLEILGTKNIATVNGLFLPPFSSILNVRFDGVDNETLLLLLEANGVIASAGSACHDNESEPSHVLKAMGLSDEEARSSVRFSFSSYNTEEEVAEAAKIVAKSVEKMLKVKSKEDLC